MEPLEFYIKLKSFPFEYDGDDTKELRFEKNEGLTALLTENEIDSEDKHGKICISKTKMPITFFFNKEEFVGQIKESDFLKPIVIYKYLQDEDLIYSNHISQINNEVAEDFLISNTEAFFESKNFFKANSQERESGFEFVDFYSEGSRQITFISIKEKTKLKFKISPTGTINLDTKINYRAQFDKLKHELETENKQFAIFLKNSIISNLVNEDGDKYEAFFKKNEKILNDAKLNFNVFLHELSLDKIKAEYKDYKQKYFSGQNDILSKITTHVVALPISIAASSFSLYNLKGEIFPTLILGFALVSYIVYVTFIVKIYMNDIVSLHDQSKRDYKILAEQTFFKENKDELIYFKTIKASLSSRLKSLIVGLKIFTIIMWLASITLVIYGTLLINPDLHLLFPLLITAFIFAMIYNQLFYNQILEED